MTKPLYAIGDIHGQLGALNQALDLITADGGPDAHVVFLGDYTDRGPDSKGVLDLLVQGRADNRNWTLLRGNHDRMFAWFMHEYPLHDAYLPIDLYWLHARLGGDTTLASYGIDFTERNRQLDVHAQALAAVPQSHVDLLNTLKPFFETNDLFFAHAGIRPGVPLDQQDIEDLLWIRKEFHAIRYAHPKLIVHGHTPVDRPHHYGNRINLDTGAGYGKPLTTAVFEGKTCWTLTPKGRVPLTP